MSLEDATNGPEAAAHEVTYRSSRAEVWRWYWRAWARRRGLWRVHLLIAACVAIGCAAATGHLLPTEIAVVFVMAFVACVALFPLWPQVRFKTQQRSLTIDASGWRTRIGKIHGARGWREVESVEYQAGAVCIVGTNGNALIVPQRAFADEAARQVFLQDARRWHAAARGAATPG